MPRFHVEATVEIAIEGDRDAVNNCLTRQFYGHDMDFTVRDGLVTARVQDGVEVDLSHISMESGLQQALNTLWQSANEAFRAKHNCDVLQLQVCISR